MEKLAAAAAVGRSVPRSAAVGPGDPMPAAYWQAVLDDASADTRPAVHPIQEQRLSNINRHLLCVACRRRDRTIEIQKVDAVHLYGPDATWKDVGHKLLDSTCR